MNIVNTVLFIGFLRAITPMREATELRPEIAGA